MKIHTFEEKVPTDIYREIKRLIDKWSIILEIVDVRYASAYKEDEYLYMVLVKNPEGDFTFWTAYNRTTKSLNHGHYKINSKELALQYMKEYFHS